MHNLKEKEKQKHSVIKKEKTALSDKPQVATWMQTMAKCCNNS